jgi:hypothetical protein
MYLHDIWYLTITRCIVELLWSLVKWEKRDEHITWILSDFFNSPTDAQESCFKKNIKIYIKTAPTCFGLITIIRERIIRAY